MRPDRLRIVRRVDRLNGKPPSSVSFKGTREGLCVTLGEGTWREVMGELAAQLDRPGAQSFFRGARVLLETGNRPIEVIQLEELIALLAQHEMTLVSVMGEPQTQETFDQLRSSLPPPPESLGAGNGNGALADLAEARLIRRTVRSGQVIHHTGTVVVLGDVNPAAEVIAEGDVIVWGKLRGVVHAGSAGDEKAIVGALILQPTQLRIGGLIARAPDTLGKRTHHALAEIARVRDGQIVVEPWGGL